MSYTRPRKHHPKWPTVANPFDFTDQELWRMQRGLLASTRMMAYSRWGMAGYRQYGQETEVQRYNTQKSSEFIRVVRTAVPTKAIPARELQLVYEAAHAAYNNAKRFRADEATARRKAVLSAQTAMEFVSGVFRKVHIHRSTSMQGSNRCSECARPA